MRIYIMIDIIIDGIKISVPITHTDDITVTALVDIAKEQQKDSALVEYLKKRYDGFIGVPTEYMKEETDLDIKFIKSWLKSEFGRKHIEFVPFELVAEMMKHESKSAS